MAYYRSTNGTARKRQRMITIKVKQPALSLPQPDGCKISIERAQRTGPSYINNTHTMGATINNA